MRRAPSQDAALELVGKMAEAMRIESTGQWGPCAGVRRSLRRGAALAVATKAHDMVEVHRVLVHPCEEKTQKMAQAIRNRDDGPVGALRGVRAGGSETAGRAVD